MSERGSWGQRIWASGGGNVEGRGRRGRTKAELRADTAFAVPLSQSKRPRLQDRMELLRQPRSGESAGQTKGTKGESEDASSSSASFFGSSRSPETSLDCSSTTSSSFGEPKILSTIGLRSCVADLCRRLVFACSKSQQADIPPWLLAQMTANNLASFGMGMVPFAGDVAGAVFKTNSRK